MRRRTAFSALGATDGSGPQPIPFRAGLLALGLIALWLVALGAGGASLPLDAHILARLHPADRTLWVDAAWAVTWLGDGVVLVPLAVATAGFLMIRRRWAEALTLIAVTASVRLLVTVQKHGFGHARPDVHQWMPESAPGFPSGHAANSLITWVALAMLLTGSRSAMAAALVLSFLVGLSRVVLGVHWPSDVIGGWALGALAAVVLWHIRIRLARAVGRP